MILSAVLAVSVLPDDSFWCRDFTVMSRFHCHVERSRDIYKSLMYADNIDIQ